jgi:hypothetical protein
MLRFTNLCRADFSKNQIWYSCLVKHLPDLLAQSYIPKHVSHNLAQLLRKFEKFRDSDFKLWIFVHNCQNLAKCMFVPLVTSFLNHIPFYRGSSILVHSHPTGSHFCCYVLIDDAGSASADVETWTLMNYFEEGGFPALLWDTLSDFGYTIYPEY